MILADLRMDSVTIGSGLLHDTVEDCDVTVAQLQQEFGEEVALIVDGVTKLGRVEFSRQEERQASESARWHIRRWPRPAHPVRTRRRAHLYHAPLAEVLATLSQ